MANFMGESKKRYRALHDHALSLDINDSTPVRVVCANLAVNELYVEDIAYISKEDIRYYATGKSPSVSATLNAKLNEFITKNGAKLLETSDNALALTDVHRAPNFDMGSSLANSSEDRTFFAKFLEQHLETQQEFLKTIRQQESVKDRKKPIFFWNIESRLKELRLSGSIP